MRRIAIASILCATLCAAVASTPRTHAADKLPHGATAPAQILPSTASGCTPSRPHASGTTVESITTSDGTRSYRLHIPPSYTGSDAVPLVLNIHGANSNAAEQEGYSGFSAKSDAEGFIVAYPQGVITSLINFTHFNAWLLAGGEPDDVGFMNTLIDALAAQLCTDPARVFSTGISNGAMMSTRLACSLSNRIAAVGPVAGAYYPPDWTTYPTEPCPDTRPVPMIAFHGTADTTVPYNGGPSSGSGPTYRLPLDNNDPSEDVMSDWATHNGCLAPRQETQVDTEVRLIKYLGCPQGATVELYAVDGGGHTWPGAIDIPPLGYTTHQISATDLIWSFFSTFPLPPPPKVGGVAQPPDIASLPVTDAGDRGAAPPEPLSAPERGGRRPGSGPWPLLALAVLAAPAALTASVAVRRRARRR